MKKALKIILTIVLILGGLFILTFIRLGGIHLLGINISSEAVNMFVDTAGTYMYITYVAVVLLVLWGFWIGRAIRKSKKGE